MSPIDKSPSGEATSADDSSRARVKAIDLLARREHSARELERKLVQKGTRKEIAGEVIAALSNKGLVSDDRFAESFVRQRAARGHGPAKIKAELVERGLDAQTIERQFAAADIDWEAMARTVRQRKYGSSLPGTFSERAKQGRFLQYRGFTADQIRYALESSFEEFPGASDPHD